MNPRFSVIVPVCHGGGLLRDALVSLARLAPPAGGFELLVTGEKNRERFREERMKSATAAVLAGISRVWIRKRPALAVMVPGLLFSLHLARAVGYVSAGRSGMRALP